jgi:hypothetical protein
LFISGRKCSTHTDKESGKGCWLMMSASETHIGVDDKGEGYEGANVNILCVNSLLYELKKFHRSVFL